MVQPSVHVAVRADVGPAGVCGGYDDASHHRDVWVNAVQPSKRQRPKRRLKEVRGLLGVGHAVAHHRRSEADPPVRLDVVCGGQGCCFDLNDPKGVVGSFPDGVDQGRKLQLRVCDAHLGFERCNPEPAKTRNNVPGSRVLQSSLPSSVYPKAELVVNPLPVLHAVASPADSWHVRAANPVRYELGLYESRHTNAILGRRHPAGRL